MSTEPDPRLSEIEARDKAVGPLLEVPHLSEGYMALLDRRALLAELRKAQDALGRVEGLAAEWEAKAGPGTKAEEVFGLQKVSVKFAVDSIRAAVAAATGGGEVGTIRRSEADHD